MLNTPSDYEFVNVSDVGSFIRGEVLPVRFSASSSTGKYATCNYEDYLYLLESYYERINYDQDGQNNIAPANRTLSSTYVRPLHWPHAVGGIPGLGDSQYVNPQATAVSSLTELQSSSSYPPIQNYQMSLSSNDSAYRYSPRSPSYRELELWGRFFYDYHRLTKLVCNKSVLTNICTENPSGSGTTRSYRNDGSYRDYPESYSTYTGSTYFYVYVHANNPSQGGSESIASFSWNFKNTLMYAPHAIRAKLLVQFSLGSTKNYCYPIDLTISNGNISLPTNVDWVSDAVRAILQLNNLPYITSFQGYQQGVADNTRIQMGNFFMIIDFDFPADYSSWNWQPT